MQTGSISAGLVTAALLLPSDLCAQSVDNQSKNFARTFVGACVQNFPDIERTKIAAKAFDWREITDQNMRALMAPAEPGGQFSMWSFRDSGYVYLIAVAERKIGSADFRSCGLVQDHVDIPQVLQSLSELLKPRKLNEITEAGQRNTVWAVRKDDKDFVVMINDGSPMQMPMITVTIMTDPRKKN